MDRRSPTWPPRSPSTARGGSTRWSRPDRTRRTSTGSPIPRSCGPAPAAAGDRDPPWITDAPPHPGRSTATTWSAPADGRPRGPATPSPAGRLGGDGHARYVRAGDTVPPGRASATRLAAGARDHRAPTRRRLRPPRPRSLALRRDRPRRRRRPAGRRLGRRAADAGRPGRRRGGGVAAQALRTRPVARSSRSPRRSTTSCTTPASSARDHGREPEPAAARRRRAASWAPVLDGGATDARFARQLADVDVYVVGRHGEPARHPRRLRGLWGRRVGSARPLVSVLCDRGAVPPDDALVADLEGLGPLHRTDALPAGVWWLDVEAPTRGRDRRSAVRWSPRWADRQQNGRRTARADGAGRAIAATCRGSPGRGADGAAARTSHAHRRRDDERVVRGDRHQRHQRRAAEHAVPARARTPYRRHARRDRRRSSGGASTAWQRARLRRLGDECCQATAATVSQDDGRQLAERARQRPGADAQHGGRADPHERPARRRRRGRRPPRARRGLRSAAYRTLAAISGAITATMAARPARARARPPAPDGAGMTAVPRRGPRRRPATTRPRPAPADPAPRDDRTATTPDAASGGARRRCGAAPGAARRPRARRR